MKKRWIFLAICCICVWMISGVAFASSKGLPFGCEGQYGLIDAEGTVLLSAKFDRVTPLLQYKEEGVYAEANAGFYVVGRKNGSKLSYALYTSTGKAVTGFVYDSILRYGDRIWAQGSEGAQLFTAEGESLLKLSGISNYSEGMVVTDSKGVAVYTSQGKRVPLQDEWRDIGAFRAGMARAVDANGNVGYIDAQGRTVVAPEFDAGASTDVSSAGTACVSKNGVRMWVDGVQGARTCEWEQVQLVQPSLFSAASGGKWAMLDAKGEPLTKAIYSALSADEYGHVRAKTEGVLFTPKGNAVKLPSSVSAADVTPVGNSLYLVNKAGKMGVFDANGKWIIQGNKVLVTQEGPGLFVARSASGVSAINGEGVVLVPESAGYRSIHYAAQGTWLVETASGSRAYALAPDAWKTQLP